MKTVTARVRTRKKTVTPSRRRSEAAKGLDAGTLPPFLGIRIKTFSEELHARSIRTLDLFLTALTEASGGRLPENFVVTLPKIVTPAQVAVLADIFDLLEPRLNLPKDSLKMEMMIETTQSIINERGEIASAEYAGSRSRALRGGAFRHLRLHSEL